MPLNLSLHLQDSCSYPLKLMKERIFPANTTQVLNSKFAKREMQEGYSMLNSEICELKGICV